jgi:hypothetical protein
MRSNAGQTAVRADRLENRAPRSSVLQVVDYPKEAAFYSALMNWKDPQRRRQAGGARHRRLGRTDLRGGYVAPPRHRLPNRDRDPQRHGGSRRPWRRAAVRARRATAVFDSFCWGIEPWDAKKVEAELRKRGLAPVADNHGEFPELPRQGSGRLRSANQQRQPQEPSSGRGQRARRRRRRRSSHELEDRLARSHFVRGFQLQGNHGVLHRAPRLESRHDEGSQNQCEIGDIGDIIIRRGGGGGTWRRRRHDSAGAAREHGAHRVRHRRIRSGSGEGRLDKRG